MRDLTPVPDLVQGTGLTGAARARRPVYVDLLPPCNAGCPAGEEAAAAEREGVTINWLRTITAFDGPELTVETMELGPDGYPQPTGRYETLTADTLILALGQDADTRFLRAVPGVEFKRDGTVTQPEAVREATRCLSC